MEEIRFTLNGRPVAATVADPHTTLLEYVRSVGLVGAKEGCGEGECGACAVVMVAGSEGEGGAPAGAGGNAGGTAPPRYEAVNSCLVLLPAVHGREVWTVESVASGDGLHPVQEALLRHGASQCGYCTPGFVMSMFAEYYRPGRDAFDLDVLGGNLCRCTGYRPIRDAARSLGSPRPDDPFLLRLRNGGARNGEQRRKEAGDSESEEEKGAAGASSSPAPTFVSASHARFHRPGSLGELVELAAAYPDARLVAGGTDVVVERNVLRRRWPRFISVEGVPELRTFQWGDEAVEIGAALPLSDLEARIAGRLPLLEQLMPLFASRLIRNRATLGGNLATASPIGDGAPVLLALDAEVRLVRAGGERIVPLASFFTGYRRTVLAPGEVIAAVRIPRPFAAVGRFYKVAKRERDDISTVAAAFALDMGEDGRVTRARLAYGGVAAAPVRAYDAEKALVGRVWDVEAMREAQRLADAAFEPISDHRGSAAYRRALVRNLIERFYYDTAGVTTWA